MAKWTKVGAVLKSKKGSLYIKIDTDVSLKKGMNLTLQDPRKKLEESVAAGRLTEEKAEEYRTKIPDFVRQDIFLVEN